MSVRAVAVCKCERVIDLKKVVPQNLDGPRASTFSAISATPALSGSKLVWSCEPPSGKMPMQPPPSSRRNTSWYISRWSILGYT